MPPEPTAVELELGRLYRSHITMVRQRCLRILGAPAMAEDIAQDVFIAFFEKYRGAPPGNASAMLYTMATNRALNALRDGRRRDELLAAEHAGRGAQPRDVGAAGADEAGLDVRRLLGRLDPELAAIGAYAYIDGMEQDEIAEVTGLHRRTVSRRLEAFRLEAQRYFTTRGAA